VDLDVAEFAAPGRAGLEGRYDSEVFDSAEYGERHPEKLKQAALSGESRAGSV